MFTTLVLLNYDLGITEAQVTALLKDILDAVLVRYDESLIEFCTQSSGWMGLGSEGRHAPGYDCGKYWIEEYYEMREGSEEREGTATGTYTWTECTEGDNGEIICNEREESYEYSYTYTYTYTYKYEWYEIYFCTGCGDCCNGDCEPCSGSRYVHHIKLRTEGIYGLARSSFINRMEELEDISSRTTAQENELEGLRESMAFLIKFIIELEYYLGIDLMPSELEYFME